MGVIAIFHGRFETKNKERNLTAKIYVLHLG